MEKLIEELKHRWTSMFTSLAAGDDVPPSLRLRAEGLMEAAVLTGAATEEELDGVMEGCYQQAFGHTIEADFGADWRDFYPFPQIPAMGRRAPVYPGTRE